MNGHRNLFKRFLKGKLLFIGLLLPLFFVGILCKQTANGALPKNTLSKSIPQKKRGRKTVAIATDNAVNKRLNDAREYLSQKRWASAIKILIAISATKKHSLTPFSDELFIDAHHYCNWLLANLPPAGLTVYRQRVDLQAKKQFQQALENRDIALMEQVANRTFASSYGDDALLQLGQWAWDRGELTAARRYWLRILPREKKVVAPQKSPTVKSPALFYPKTNLNVAMIAARCIVCDIVSGKSDRATRTLDFFRQRFPKTRGTIAGQTGVLADLLNQLQRTSRQWTFAKKNAHFSTFAGNPQRNGIQQEQPIRIGKPLWSRPLNWQQPKRSVQKIKGKSRPVERHAACFPVVVNGVVYVNIADRIFAYELATGRPAFSSDVDVPKNNDPKKIEKQQASEEEAVLYPEVLPGKRPVSVQPAIGVPRFSVTVHQNKLYARLGDPIAGRAEQETRAERSQLICYHLHPETGRLVWKISASSWGQGWEFEGAPVVANDRLFIVMRKRFPATQLFVVCFSPRTGKLIWKQSVCAAIGRVQGENVHNQVSQQLLTLSNDTIFYSTGFGAIAALKQSTGTLKWLLTQTIQWPAKLAAFNNARHRGIVSCCYFQGFLIATLPDSKTVLGIDANTGTVYWRRQLRGGVRHLLGAITNRVIVSGDRLWALDLSSGRPLWNLGYEDPVGYGFGRGLLTDRSIYWPLREEILVVHPTSGKIIRRIALQNRVPQKITASGKRTNGYGGNLLIANRYLLVAEPNRLVIYGQPQPVKK